MARKNLCPYKDGEDNLGKKGKAWGNTHTKNLYVTGEAEVQTLTVGSEAEVQKLTVGSEAEVQTLTVGSTATIPGYVKDVTKNGNTITVTKGGGESTTFNAGLNILARNKSYSVGDIAYSPNLPSYLYLECTTAGTTGATEPDMSTLSGAIVNDGTAKFSVKTVCAKEYVDAKANDEGSKWKKAYNNLRERSYPAKFNNDELTLLASNLGAGTITLSQPYTDFDGIYVEYADDNGTDSNSVYLSSWEITRRIRTGKNWALFANRQYWIISSSSIDKTTIWNSGDKYENCYIRAIYGVKFKEIT